MEQTQYTQITKTISQTISFLNHSQNLDHDDIDDIKNQALLKLTPQLKKILHFEPLHLGNFVRKTTKSVFWDYLKSTSTDLTGYRIKKRIKNILKNLEDTTCQFKRPDNDTPWYVNEDQINREIPPVEKHMEVENIIREWKMKSSSAEKSHTSDEGLTNLIKRILHQVNFGISVNDIFSSLSSTGSIEEIIQSPLEITGTDTNDEITVNIPGVTMITEVPCSDVRVDERVYYENYADEFLQNHVTPDQTRVYYLRFVTNLEYKEIEKKYRINIKTAESRLSIKPDKKGFLWRLAQFIKNLELTIEESRNFLDFLDRKIGELYSNIK
ncbi:MAG: hypothetical protein PVH61_21680 [Candidatus Aminicenantes bacterium]|jgi:hypothetical protein